MNLFMRHRISQKQGMQEIPLQIRKLHKLWQYVDAFFSNEAETRPNSLFTQCKSLWKASSVTLCHEAEQNSCH